MLAEHLHQTICLNRSFPGLSVGLERTADICVDEERGTRATHVWLTYVTEGVDQPTAQHLCSIYKGELISDDQDELMVVQEVRCVY